MHRATDFLAKVAVCLCLLPGLDIPQHAFGQTTAPGEWTWVGGSSSTYQVGIYGTQGTPSASNLPGSRSDSANWVDANGNLWMFGGLGVSSSKPWGSLSDLWKYDPSSGEWTWMGGSSGFSAMGNYGTLGTAASTNIPGARFNPASQTDKSGNFWLFGGFAVDSTGANGLVNDLWEFNPSTNEWTWMGGGDTVATSQTGVYGTLGTPAPSNIPGARESVASWMDPGGKFWFFGGVQFDSQSNQIFLSDLWSFDPSINEWTWEGGPQASAVSPGQAGVYGTLGTPAPANIPGGRVASNRWIDLSGNLWLFGGEGNDSKSTTGFLGDLWKFNPATNQWTWMGGSNTTTSNSCSAGTYGTLGTPSASNLPGGRDGASVWTDKYGRFWMFGGYGCDSAGGIGNLGDLWMFDPSQNEWTWIDGSNVVNPTGTYGSLGVPAQNNVPGGRIASPTWTGSDGTQWLFGGFFSEPNNQFNLYTDLWAFQVPVEAEGSPAAMTSPAPGSVLPGSNATFTWTAGTQVTKYSLWLGTQGAGSNDLYEPAAGNYQSATVSNLPTYGATIYARLWSTISNKWQWIDYTYTASGSPTPAAMISPASGSVLSGSTQTFTWTTGSGVTKYSLWLGTQGVGSNDLYEPAAGNYQSATVTNLPTDGVTIYARLWSTINNKWQWIDYTYTAGSTPAAMISPASGSVLSGSTLTFTWTTGSGVTKYSLWLGTQGVGSNDLYEPTAGNYQSATVTNLPADGVKIYARLWSTINNKWQWIDYTYTAGGSPTPATMISPSPGSVLPGASSTFTWTAGAGVTKYSLWLGTQGVGSNDLYEPTAGNYQSVTVTNLPTNGEMIYARLWSTINNKWQWLDYTYSAH